MMTSYHLHETANLFTDGDWVESKDQDPHGDVRLIQLADIGVGQFTDKSSRFLTKETAKRLRCTFLQAGDVLIARMPDPIGRACIFPDLGRTCVTAVDVSILRPKTGFNAEFLVGRINAPQFRSEVLLHANGATRKRISRKNLGNVKIDIPALHEQHRIGVRIKECMERVEEIQGLRAESEDETQLFLRAYYHDIYEELVESVPTRPLAEFGNVCGGGTPSKKRPDFWSGTIPWVSPREMKVRDIRETSLAITEAAVSGSSVKLLKKPAVLFVVRGMILAHTLPVAVNRVPVTLNQDMKAISPHEGMNVDFLATMIRGAERRLLGKIEVAGHGTRRLRTEHWSTIPIPDLDESQQEALLAEVASVESAADSLRADVTSDEVGLLRESILRKAFAGEL